MKKSLIAAAIAVAVAAPAANAGVVIYGKIHASVDYVDSDNTLFDAPFVIDGEPADNTKGWYVTNRTSRIGFKGTEDLGNGLSLIWKAETSYNLSESGNGWGGGRNAYIGLNGDWGTFLYGRHDTPFKISGGKLDLFADTMADFNSTLGFDDVRAPNAIAYISPNMNGFTVAGAIVPGESPNPLTDNDVNGLADAYSIAAMYTNNGLYLAAAYEDLANGVEGVDNKKWRIGSAYTLNAFTVTGIYEDQDFGGSNHKKAWQIGSAYDFGNNRVKAMYGSTKFENDLGEIDGAAWAVGFDHKLSKRTKAYILYAASDFGLHNHTSFFAPAGIGGSSWDGSGNFVDDNVDPNSGIGKSSGFSMGMMHNF